jgi:uncharacterized membrane protein
MIGTYGLGTSVRGPSGNGDTILGLGANQQKQATEMLGRVAEEETKRNIANKQALAADKAGNVQLASVVGGLAGGAYAGATYGSAAGPWGMLIGGVIGAVAGGLF